MVDIPSIGQLNRLIRICSSDDVVTDGTLCLRRKDIRSSFAKISPLSQGATWTASGRNAGDRPTHKITIRAMPDLEITRTAWLYEERSAAANRWYKVLQAQESEDAQWWIFQVIIDSRTDTITPVDTSTGSGLARQVKL